MTVALDTNVLVRLAVKDDERQARRARAVVARAHSSGDPVFVSVIVLCELVWVLRSAYGRSRADIAGVLRILLSASEIVVEDAELARRALADYETSGIDFADALIGHRNRQAGCEVTLTFDRRLRRSDLFAAP